MHKAILATVGLLLVSVAALPVPATDAGTGESAEPTGSQYVAAVGSAATASVVGATARPERRLRSLALPGVDSIDRTLLLVAGGILGLLFGLGALLVGRRGSSAAGRQAAGAGAEPDGERNPATSAPAEGRDPERGSPAVRTDEEYVVQLLIANHGRMRQARIVEETDWSKAKVSRVLSRMEERGQVVRERAGREKIVQLADANTSIPI